MITIVCPGSSRVITRTRRQAKVGMQRSAAYHECVLRLHPLLMTCTRTLDRELDVWIRMHGSGHSSLHVDIMTALKRLKRYTVVSVADCA